MDIRPGFSWASLLAWVALVAISIYLIYVATHKTDVDNYSKGSASYSVTENNYPLSLHPCGALFDIKKEPEVKK